MNNQVIITITKNVSNFETLSTLQNYKMLLCITATRSMKFIAKQNSDFNVIDFTEFQHKLNELTKTKDCLREQDIKYILSQTINKMQRTHCKLAFKNSLNEIFELFSKLLIAEVNQNDIDLKAVNKLNNISSKELIDLYVEFLINIESKGKTNFYQERNKVMENYFHDYTDIALYGFAFFNDLQNVLFRKLIHNQKKINIIINNDSFLLNDWLKPLLKRENISYKIIRIESKEEDQFFELKEKIFTNKKIENNTIKQNISIIEPFSTREMEFEYIAKEITKLLMGARSREEVQKRCDDIAIVITNNFAKNTELINDIFNEIGVFISPDGEITYRNLRKKEIDVSDCVHLQVYQPTKSLFKSPIGKFILEIYKIAGKGMSIASFNNLLSVGRIFSDNEYIDCISEFAIIKEFFANINDINDWVEQIQNLKNIKSKIFSDEDCYDGHPAISIKIESLQYLENYIKFISNIVTKIKNINGTIKNQINALINAIIQETKNKLIEVCLLNMFIKILQDTHDGVEYDPDYFSKNFIDLIAEYIAENNNKEDCIKLNAINLESVNQYDTVFMPMFECDKYPAAYKYSFPYNKEIVETLDRGETIKKYILPVNKTKEYNLQLSKYVFRNLFRIAKKKIIFTMIDNEKGLPLDISIFGNDIMNLCHIKPIHQVKINFDNCPQKKIDLIFKKSKIIDLYLNELLEYNVCPKLFYYIVNHKDKMTFNDKFLMTFYARALLYNKTFKNLADNNQIYCRETISNITKIMFEKAATEIFEILPLFDDNSIQDIKLTTFNQVQNFLLNKIFSGKFAPKNQFTITLAPAKQIYYKGIKVKTRKNIILKDLTTKVETEFDISKALDYLVSSSGGMRTDKTHFNEIIEDMKNNNKFFDRMYALNFLSFKINTQLNVPRYIKDGEKRIKELIDDLGDFEYSNLGFNKSSFCSYCKIKNICLEVEDD